MYTPTPLEELIEQIETYGTSIGPDDALPYLLELRERRRASLPETMRTIMRAAEGEVK